MDEIIRRDEEAIPIQGTITRHLPLNIAATQGCKAPVASYWILLQTSFLLAMPKKKKKHKNRLPLKHLRAGCTCRFITTGRLGVIKQTEELSRSSRKFSERMEQIRAAKCPLRSWQCALRFIGRIKRRQRKPTERLLSVRLVREPPAVRTPGRLIFWGAA